MELIGVYGLADASIVDVGGGASTLVDDLMSAGYADITVVDIADQGMSIARQRLGASAARVTWIATDLLAWEPGRTFDIWHDRAVLHFLTSPGERLKYNGVLRAATHSGSRVVIGAFGPKGPEMCSGLPVYRYDDDAFADLLPGDFDIVNLVTEDHETPSGGSQEFRGCVAERN